MTELTQSCWPATPDNVLRATTCGGVLREAAAEMPDRHCLVRAHADPALRTRLTFADLLARAEGVAQMLVQRFPRGTHIALWAANCPEWVVVQFGIALAGMVMVTVNPAYRPHELGYVLRQSRSRAVFHQSAYRGMVMADAITEACAQEGIAMDLMVCLDDPATFGASAARVDLPDVEPADFAMIQYTSGTTGHPKGVLLTHHSVTNTSRIMAEIKLQTASTVNLSVAPLFHTGGCVGGVLASIQTRGTLLVMDTFEPELMLDLIEQERVTYTFAVPTMLIALLQAQQQRPRDLSSLETVFSGGAIVPVDIVRRTEAEFGVRLIIGYGLTESSPAITHTRPDDTAEDKSETIGRPIPLVDVKIVDPASGAIQPIGTPGELCARGFNVMAGYFDMPEATAETVDADGWLHSGDLCTMDARGYCRVTGRLKDMIIRGGENIYPREIEEALFLHPAVAAAAVFAVPDAYWGEQVAAAISFRPGLAAGSDELATFAGTRLARHKVPRFWFLLDEFPLTASGKVQKYRLGEMFATGALEPDRF